MKLLVLLTAFILASGQAAHCRCSNMKHGNVTAFEDAVTEVMKRGQRMIPMLAALRGCRNTFFGGGLGNPQSSQLIPAKHVPGLPVIPVEQAALFLIEGIYKGNYTFAQSPYLVDLTLPSERREPSASPELNKRAWKAVAGWNARYRREGLEHMRTQGDDPLAAAGVAFW